MCVALLYTTRQSIRQCFMASPRTFATRQTTQQEERGLSPKRELRHSGSLALLSAAGSPIISKSVVFVRRDVWRHPCGAATDASEVRWARCVPEHPRADLWAKPRSERPSSVRCGPNSFFSSRAQPRPITPARRTGERHLYCDGSSSPRNVSAHSFLRHLLVHPRSEASAGQSAAPANRNWILNVPYGEKDEAKVRCDS